MVAEKKKPKIEQTDDGVQITRPGRVLRDDGCELAVYRKHAPPTRCPYCKRDGREGLCDRVTGSAPGITYYRCRECCDPEDGSQTTFKVLTTAPGDG